MLHNNLVLRCNAPNSFAGQICNLLSFSGKIHYLLIGVVSAFDVSSVLF